MAYLKYYRTENEQHKDMWKAEQSFKTCLEMAKALFDHFKVPDIPVELLDKSKKKFARLRRIHSYYQPKNIFRKLDRHIVLHPTMLNPLTVAHEVAHYVHDLDRQRRRANWKGKDFAKEFTRQTFCSNDLQKRVSGSLISGIVDQAVSVAMRRDIATGSMTPGLTFDDITAAVQAVEAQNRKVQI